MNECKMKPAFLFLLQDGLKIIPNKPLTSMKNAIRFARSFNYPSDDDDRHFDFAVVFTRENFGYAGRLSFLPELFLFHTI